MTHRIEIEVVKTGNEFTRIEGLCEVKGFRGMVDVIAFSKMQGKWHTASSMCFPSDIVGAKQVHECVSAAFDKLAEIEALETNGISDA